MGDKVGSCDRFNGVLTVCELGGFLPDNNFRTRVLLVSLFCQIPTCTFCIDSYI